VLHHAADAFEFLAEGAAVVGHGDGEGHCVDS
jgi:hypothetical protein